LQNKSTITLGLLHESQVYLYYWLQVDTLITVFIL